jgi:hypothetical protein
MNDFLSDELDRRRMPSVGDLGSLFFGRALFSVTLHQTWREGNLDSRKDLRAS